MDPVPKSDVVASEAAEWFARLNARTVSVGDLEAFRTWRSDPDRRAAYESVEAIWRTAGTLRGDPEIEALANKAVRPRRRSPIAWNIAGVVAAAVVLGVGVWATMRTDTLQTDPGERRTIRLADGSSVSLDTDSLVRVHIGPGSRDLELVRGQALFDVAHDARRPFRVEANGSTVVATGTRFGVRLVGDAARVVLLDGGVTVAEGEGAGLRRWRLVAGQEIITGDSQFAGPVALANAESASSWVNGRLVFDGTPLAAAISEVNRYGGRPIQLASGVDRAIPISGEFDSGDEVAFVDAVARLYGLGLRSEQDALVLVPLAAENNS